MEQQQFKVKVSLGTKLLLSVIILLASVITFLAVSTVVLITEDKKAYTFQAQSAEASLAGQVMSSILRHSFDGLKQSLSLIDPLKPIGGEQQAALQRVINNSTDILGIAIYEVTQDEQTTGKRLIEAVKSDFLLSKKLKSDDLFATPEIISVRFPDILLKGYGFYRLTKPEGFEILGFGYIDPEMPMIHDKRMIAVGAVSLESIGKESRSSRLSITDNDGFIMFDNLRSISLTKKNISDETLFQLALNTELSSGAREYLVKNERILGAFNKPGFGTVVLSRLSWQKAMRATYTLIEKYILLGIMSLCGAIIFGLYFSKSITRPLLKVFEATKEVAKGNFEIKIQKETDDEVGALSESFVAMSHQIKELIKEQVKLTHMENELAVAAAVQQTLFPEALVDMPNITVHSFYKSASECGGDWWGLFQAQNKVSIMIADATGHGVPSALITAAARSCFSVIYRLAENDSRFALSPSNMLAYANRVVHDASKGKIMMTFFAGVFDFDTGILKYSSAGHNPPWLFHAKNGGFKLNSLTTVGQRLGEDYECPAFEEKQIPFHPDDILFLYTDGLTEGKDSKDEMYGKKRARKSVESNLAKGPRVVIDELMKEFDVHNGSKPYDDDVTLAVAIIKSFSGKS